MKFPHYSMNQIMIAGTIGLKEAMELQRTQNGKPMLRFIAYTVEKDGQDKDFQDFRCTIFGQRAEFASKYIQPGSKVVVTGKLSFDTYTMDRTVDPPVKQWLRGDDARNFRGEKHCMVSVMADQLVLIEGPREDRQTKSDPGPSGGYGSSQRQSGYNNPPGNGKQSGYGVAIPAPPDDDDIPF